MIGAYKLNKNDILKIRNLISQGVNDYQIAREFISESGESVTREHIRAIRKGQRWNKDNRSFLMKDELSDLPVIKTEMNGRVFETQLGWLKTKDLEKWFFLTLMDDMEVDGPMGYLMDKKPLKKEILAFHNSFVSSYL
jgi:hypothetical protein